MNILKGKTIDKIFEFVIGLKSFFGFFELLAGIFFAVSGKLIINNLIINFAQQEIAEDPNDFFANYLISSTSDFTAGSYLFAVAYLISHGVINIFLAAALLRGKLWAYPLAIGGFGTFTIYQIYRFFHTYSPALFILTIFDIFIIAIIWLEYRKKI